jgi:hypothetical protein
MAKEYLGLREINGPLVMLDGVSGVTNRHGLRSPPSGSFPSIMESMNLPSLSSLSVRLTL